MNREIHVPLRESLKVRFLRATRPHSGCERRFDGRERRQR